MPEDVHLPPLKQQGILSRPPGTMDEVIRAAIRWFDMWLPDRPAERLSAAHSRLRCHIKLRAPKNSCWTTWKSRSP